MNFFSAPPHPLFRCVPLITSAILLACLPISKPFKVLVGLSGLGTGLMFLGVMVQFTAELLRSGHCGGAGGPAIRNARSQLII